MSLAADVLRRAAGLPLADDPDSWSPWHQGHGLVRAVKQAAGLRDDAPWTDEAIEAYQAAHEPLSLMLDPLVKRGPYGAAETSPLKTWAKNKTEEERRELLLTLAKELA